jgi:pimeloyl-ACP methyl ester carboxylesterase
MTVETVTSADGTTIAFERRGSGPVVILIGGAANTRHAPPIAALPMADLLSPSFTAIAYDRRGRGESGNTLPYAVAREVEDLAAIIAAVGPAFLFGHSSGGGLALQAAIAGLAIPALAIYETPYSMDEAAVADANTSQAELVALLDAGRNGEAMAGFMAMTGMPDEMIEGMRQSPEWPALERIAPTLAYDNAVMAQGAGSRVPSALIAGIDEPLLGMAGGESPDWMKAAVRAVVDAAPQGRYHEVAGADHMVDEAIVAPLLIAFFGGR